MAIDPSDVRRRAGLFLFLGLAVAGGTAWVGYTLVSRREAQLEAQLAQEERIDVVIATEELRAGVPIAAESVGVVRRAKTDLPPDAIFDTVDGVAGQVPRQTILRGEVIRTERLQVGPGGLEAQVAIEPGSRAVSLRVEAALGVAGLLEPGFCVDIIVTVRPESEAIDADWVTETILQDVRVIAIEDARAVREESRPAPRRDLLVTLEVGPEEAERLAMATTLGKVHLSLRHADDHELLEHRGPLITNAMMGIAPKSTASKRRRTKWSKHHHATEKTETKQTAEVIQGSSVDVQTFDSAGQKVTRGQRGR